MWVTVFWFLHLHNLVSKLQFLVLIEFTVVDDRNFSWAEIAAGSISILTYCEAWIPANDEDAFGHWIWNLDITDLSTSDIEYPESHITSSISLKSLFGSLFRTTGKWVALWETLAVIWEITMQKYVVLFSTCGFTACPDFATLRQVTWFQTTETQLEHLDMVSSFLCFYWFELFSNLCRDIRSSYVSLPLQRLGESSRLWNVVASKFISVKLRVFMC